MIRNVIAGLIAFLVVAGLIVGVGALMLWLSTICLNSFLLAVGLKQVSMIHVGGLLLGVHLGKKIIELVTSW